MAKKTSKALGRDIQGLILPKEGDTLKALWRAFEKGSTWYRKGKRRTHRMRLGHTAYQGRVALDWWGKAIKYSVQDGDGSGKIAGAFLGHAQRHGGSAIDRMDVKFS
jgi:hypothetical protein